MAVSFVGHEIDVATAPGLFDRIDGLSDGQSPVGRVGFALEVGRFAQTVEWFRPNISGSGWITTTRSTSAAC